MITKEEVYAYAPKVLGASMEEWMETIIPALGWITPNAMLEMEGGPEKVMQVILAIEHSVYL